MSEFTDAVLMMALPGFMCGTAAEVTPVREVDNRTVGQGRPGPVVKAVQEAYFRTVRAQEPKYLEWLTYV